MAVFHFPNQNLSHSSDTIVLCGSRSFGDGTIAWGVGVDRYGGYNKAPCDIQYCYEHLKRPIEDLVKEFPKSEVRLYSFNTTCSSN